MNDGGIEIRRFHGGLYALGEYILDRTFQNRVIDAIIASHRDFEIVDGKRIRCIPIDAVGAIYNATPADSPARKMLVDYHVKFGSAEWLDISLADANEQSKLEFLRDVAAALLDKWEFNGDDEEDLCGLDEGVPSRYYHEETGKQNDETVEENDGAGRVDDAEAEA